MSGPVRSPQWTSTSAPASRSSPTARRARASWSCVSDRMPSRMGRATSPVPDGTSLLLFPTPQGSLVIFPPELGDPAAVETANHHPLGDAVGRVIELTSARFVAEQKPVRVLQGRGQSGRL